MRPRNDDGSGAAGAGSLIVRAFDRGVSAVQTSWTGSAARAGWMRGTRPFRGLSIRATTRLTGLSLVAAASTALVIRMASTHPEPLTWMIPASVAGAGAILVVAGRGGT